MPSKLVWKDSTKLKPWFQFHKLTPEIEETLDIIINQDIFFLKDMEIYEKLKCFKPSIYDIFELQKIR